MAFTLRTDQRIDEALTALAEAEGVSRQEVIRRSVLDRYDRMVHTGHVSESASRLADRWGDVLDRLGRV